MKHGVMLTLVISACLVSGCASSEAVDHQADEALGISQPAADENAEQSLQEAKEARIQEAQRNLQRQISEPIQAGFVQ